MLEKDDFKFILGSFIAWRVFLAVVLLLSIKFIPLQFGFLGGGEENYLNNPNFWAWINFDGEHYLSIAYSGYKPLTYFYFPVYPFVVSGLAFLVGKSFISLAVVGLLVSNLAFLLALIGIYKLIILDYAKKTAKKTILLILVFPTSYYFASFYTESLFLALVVWSFYFIRKEKWLHGSLFAGVATATRVVGIVLLPTFLAEYWQKYKDGKKVSILLIVASLMTTISGLFLYLFFVYKQTGDPLEFVRNIHIFGQQRSSDIVLLPRVFYRYVFKIFPNINYEFLPVVYSTTWEFLTAVIFLILAIVSIIKLRLSYSLYLIFGFVIPTLSGSFSSLPRYVLVLFPAFLMGALLLNKLPTYLQYAIFILLFVGLSFSASLYLRGYWIS